MTTPIPADNQRWLLRREELSNEVAELEKKRDELQEWLTEAGATHKQLTQSQANLRASGDALRSRLEDIKGEVARAKATRDEAHSELEILRKQLAADKEAAASYQTQAVRFREKESVLQSQLDKLQRKVDEQIATYENTKRAESEARLSDLTEQASALELKVATANGEVAKRRQEVADLTNTLDSLRSSDTQESTRLKVEVTTLQAQLKELSGRHTEAEDNLKKLRYETNLLVARRDKAKDEYDRYVEYEEKSRKELRAADVSLKEREAALSEAARYAPKRNSFLPPL